MNTVMRVPGPSTDVLISHECTKPMSPVFSARIRSRRSSPTGDSKPDRPPMSVWLAYSFDVLSMCCVVVRNPVLCALFSMPVTSIGAKAPFTLR